MSRPQLVRGLIIALAIVVWGYGWGMLEHAAVAQIYFEPTDDAKARAVTSLPTGFFGAATLAAVTLAAAFLLKRPWILLTATPGVVGAASLATVPGITFLTLLLTTLLVGVVIVVIVVRAAWTRQTP